MATATISPKYQVVIPKEIRREISIESGQTVQIVAKGGVISLIPDRPLKELKGYLSGLSTESFRDKADRL
ncbi:MAG: AbrB/MazE/SpoVT family DNA-binding domain-containing protein [Deltaproteobacteria bacterium]|nr:AbrB/MazE/SpoVT family DNA-binding domain-containing protein [Deltaproteobacteria bacterium]